MDIMTDYKPQLTITRRWAIMLTALILFLPDIKISAQAVLDIPGEETADIGLYIKDLKADTIVFSSHANENHVPASITKSLTSASAMTLLGEKFRFRTDVELRGKKSRGDSTFYGAIVIKASGDPTLDSRHFDNNGGFCDSIVAALTRLSIDSIVGTIQVEAKMPEQGQVETWEIEDTPWPYGAGIYGLNYKDNTMKVYPATGKSVPHSPNLEIVKSYGRGSSLSRGIGSSVLTVRGTKKKFRNSSWVVHTTMPDPASSLIHELTEKMEQAGIKINNKAIEYTSRRPIHLYTRLSPPLYETLRSLMERSDNMFAEGILRAFAPGETRQKAIERQLKLWQSRNIDTKYTNILDGSGLSRGDNFSPLFIGNILEWMSRSEYANDYISLYPRAGVNGTVKSFAKDTRFKGRLAIKSGSMNRVQCYAGYILDEQDAPTHVVVMMCNKFSCSRATLRKGLIDWLERYIPGGMDIIDDSEDILDE